MDSAPHTVVVFGSFDLLHRGHRHFLAQSRKHGQCLRVVLSRDEEILHFKKRFPVWNFSRRRDALLTSGLVDEVVSSDTRHSTFFVLQKHDRADIIVLGDGQEALGQALVQFFQAAPQYRCPVAYIAPHRRILLSSTRFHQIRQLSAHATLIGAMLFWSSSWVLGRVVATSGLPPPLATTLRTTLLAGFFLVWQLGTILSHPMRLKSFAGPSGFSLDLQNLRYLILTGLCLIAYNLCFFYGLRTVFTNQGGILTSVLVPVFSALLYRTQLQRRQILGLILGSISGLILMGGLGYIQYIFRGKSAGFYWQSSLFLGTALSWSIITHLSSKIQQHYSLQKYSFYIYLFAALLSSWGWMWYQDAIQWLPLLGLVFLGSILGTSLYFLSLRFLRPHYVAAYLLLNPVLILLMSWLFLAEPWTWQLSIGSSLAIAAILLLNSQK